MIKNNTVSYPFPQGDGNINEWFLMSSPAAVVTILLSYLVFVLKVGPEFMRKRLPYSLNNVLVLYNLVQIFVSFFVFSYGVNIIKENGLIFQRQCVTDSKEFKFIIETGTYYYFLAKLSELLDTVFFVLRKRQRQVTFLHVYHHSFTMLSSWITLKYEPSNSTIFVGTINSFVHIIMYTYYGLSAFPRLSKYLWWKKYITKMQLIQFLLIIVQLLASHKVSSCRTSYILFAVIIFNTTLFFYLFANFYIKAYLGIGTKTDKSDRVGDSVAEAELNEDKNILNEAVDINGELIKKSV